MRFLLQFHNIPIYVLLGCAVATAALGHPVDTAVILAAVIANAMIGYIQEGEAERAMDAIGHMLATMPTWFVAANASASMANNWSRAALIIGTGAALFAIIGAGKQVRLRRQAIHRTTTTQDVRS